MLAKQVPTSSGPQKRQLVVGGDCRYRRQTGDQQRRNQNDTKHVDPPNCFIMPAEIHRDAEKKLLSTSKRLLLWHPRSVMFAIGLKRTLAVALHMSAFAGVKRTCGRHGQMIGLGLPDGCRLGGHS